jgi:predicted RNase H-like HicB family nuclease
MKLLVLLHEDEEGWIVADVPALPGCMSQGRTREEALTNIQDAITGWLEAERKDGNGGILPLQIETAELIIEAA